MIYREEEEYGFGFMAKKIAIANAYQRMGERIFEEIKGHNAKLNVRLAIDDSNPKKCRVVLETGVNIDYSQKNG